MKDLPVLPSTLCIFSLFLACQKPPSEEVKEDPLPAPATVTLSLPDTEEVSLVDIFPELTESPSIREDGRMGYCLVLGEQAWEMPFSAEPAYIPAQDVAFKASVTPQDPSAIQQFNLNTVQFVVLEDICLPGKGSRLWSADCDDVFNLTIALDKNAPYRKVSLSHVEISFPSWFRAEYVGGSIPALEVTPEGVDLTFRLRSLYQPVEFIDKLGRLCYSAGTVIRAAVSASAEDALVPDSGYSPADIHFSFGFEKVEFNSYDLIYKGLTFPSETVEGEPVPLPSFFGAEGTDVELPQPYIQLTLQNDIPFSHIGLNATFASGDRKAEFSLPDKGHFMLMAEGDAVYREGIQNKDISALGKLFRLPVQGGVLRPTFSFQPAVSGEGIFEKGKSYKMSARTEGLLPLSFTGSLAVKGFETAPISLDGEAAVAHAAHEIKQTLSNQLPFDCRITPVLTIEGRTPLMLDDFVVEAWSGYTMYTCEFTTDTAPWKATLHYIVTPTKGRKIFFRKEYGLTIKNVELTLNKNE